METQTSNAPKNPFQLSERTKKRLLIFLSFLLIAGFFAAIRRVVAEPNEWWKSAILLIGITFSYYQLRQFLNGDKMLSNLGRTLNATSDTRLERGYYAIGHVVLIIGCIVLLILGKNLR